MGTVTRLRRTQLDRLRESSGLIWWDGQRWLFRRVGEDGAGDRVDLVGELPALHWFDPGAPHHSDADLETAGVAAVKAAGFHISPSSCWVIERPAPAPVPAAPALIALRAA